jgi:mannosyl-3-phosphoglycerate phosphatase family protein
MNDSAIVIFTDVDGVLRGPDSGSLADARGTLAVLGERDVPVVLCSDQTAAELMWLQEELGMRHPFICESGAALYIPPGYFGDLCDLGRIAGDWEVIEFGPALPEVTAALHRVAAAVHVRIVTQSDLSVEQVAFDGHMSLLEAQLATCRCYDEPFRIVDNDARIKTRLFTAMRAAGFRCFTGLRMHHATGVLDPAHAVRLLIALYRSRGLPTIVVGVGDDWNDRALLREADVPIVVRNHSLDQTQLLRKVPTAYFTEAAGPAGWSEAIIGSV